ncbi:hypothetical protein [Williamsoniiplasma lucivorax]|uniref:Transmembrane protein n=1 Tax=Williamsoniiplasma lucivorax TaxID=209274 RepID=A0A2S5RD47_9MOLU|nr:hypothetical protein [Williamsoniiplasma lucivorax]PPE05269.1 hypothetical protein ELUCI_v1c08050 [Williamsoniiplasma lucivorax]
MQQVQYLNLVLWIIDTTFIAILGVAYLFYIRFYNNWNIPQINSANDVISNESIKTVINTFLKEYKLEDYEVVFTDHHSHFKPFSNLKKHKKQILISKHLFVSVGYELDYIVSKIWLSAQEIKKNPRAIFYKISIKWMNWTLMIIAILAYLLQTVISFYLMVVNDLTGISNFFAFLLTSSIGTILLLATFVFFLFNYLLSWKLKEQMELAYNKDTVMIFKNTLSEYYFDFIAAREMATNIRSPLINFGKKTTKWFGPFVI